MTTPEAVRSTVADVDLDAIGANLAAVRAHANADVIAVVKADAYGHGAEAVAEACFEAGAVMLEVATVEEGLALREGGGTLSDRPRLVHAAASAGVAAFGPIDGVNAVRPGLAIYGLHAAPHLANALHLRPALAWRSRIHRLADVAKGTGVSYGHEYRLPRDGRIATVPVGYGDGLPRVAGKQGRFLVSGHPCCFAWRVGMDPFM